MVLAPLLLDLVELAPGQALFTEAGIVHSYLEGAAVELQASSDNVVRAGITEKHVDAGELLRLVRLEPTTPRILEPRAAAPGVFAFDAAWSGLFLERIELGAGRPGAANVVELDRANPRRGPEVLLCTAGAALVEGWPVDEVEAQSEPLRPSESLLVTAAASRCRLSGEATVFRAGFGTPTAARQVLESRSGRA
jgi:mannose-6-phosphate isomerase